MKVYIPAIVLCTIIAPILGATIIGTLSGNPIIIFWPAVLPVAFLAEGLPALLFTALGCLLIHAREKRAKRIKSIHITTFGLLFGFISALLPLLLCHEAGRWTITRGVLTFLLTGSLVGIACAWLAYRVIQSTKKRLGEPALSAYRRPGAASG